MLFAAGRPRLTWPSRCRHGCRPATEITKTGDIRATPRRQPGQPGTRTSASRPASSTPRATGRRRRGRAHHHATSTELFYILDGRARVLAGAEIVTLEAGDVASVLPLTAHAFAAATGCTADLLVIVAPGIQRRQAS
ncbi:cupin domain-containing protein [Nonomuraea sp. NPDC005730]